MHCSILCSEFWIESPEGHYHLNRSCTWWSFRKMSPHLYLNQYNTYIKTSHLQNEGKMCLGEKPWISELTKATIESTGWFHSTTCCALAGKSPRAAVEVHVPMAQPPCWIMPTFRAPIPQLCLLHVIRLRSSRASIVRKVFYHLKNAGINA